MAKKYLDNVGLGRMWNRIKVYLTNNYAAKSHTHTIAQITSLQTTLNGKANKATTLAGYGITDAYTKTESDGRYYRPLATQNISEHVVTTSKTVAVEAMDNHTTKAVKATLTGSPRTNRYLYINAPAGGTYYIEPSDKTVSGGSRIISLKVNENDSKDSASFRIFRMS